MRVVLQRLVGSAAPLCAISPRHASWQGKHQRKEFQFEKGENNLSLYQPSFPSSALPWHWVGTEFICSLEIPPSSHRWKLHRQPSVGHFSDLPSRATHQLPLSNLHVLFPSQHYILKFCCWYVCSFSIHHENISPTGMRGHVIFPPSTPVPETVRCTAGVGQILLREWMQPLNAF